MIAPDGGIVWLCAPRWDSPAVFSALLGGRGGYSVGPADPWNVWGGYYEPGSLIWRNRWVGSGVAECREALAMPADPHRAVLLRRIEAVRRPGQDQDDPGPAGRLRPQSHARPGQVGRRVDRAQRPGQVPAVRRGPRAARQRRVPGHVADRGRRRASRPGAGDVGPAAGRPAARTRFLLVRHGGRLGAGGARLRQPDRGARRPACLRRAGGPDLRQRRDGRRRDDLDPRAPGERAQLRLPLRLDPGPVLHRPRRRRPRTAPAAGRGGQVHHRANAVGRART